MKRLSIAMVLLFLSSIFTATVFAADAFELVIPLPLTGKPAKFGEIMKRSYEIAAEEINAKGGVKGRKIALSFEDSTGKPEIARSIVEKLIDSKKQPIIVGEYTSACAKAVAAVAEERKTPYLVVASADDDITQKNYKYVFRQNQVNAHYGDAVVDFLKTVVKPKTIAVLYESSAFGTSGADAMERDAAGIGAKVVLKEKFETGAIDFKPLLSKVKAAQPEVIYTVAYANEAQLIMKQAKELRIDAKLYAGGAAGFAIPEFIKGAQDAAEYVISATLWTPQLKYPGTREFADKYKAKHGDYLSRRLGLCRPLRNGRRPQPGNGLDARCHSRCAQGHEPQDRLRSREVRGQGRLPEPELPRNPRDPGAEGRVRDRLAEVPCQQALPVSGSVVEREKINFFRHREHRAHRERPPEFFYLKLCDLCVLRGRTLGFSCLLSSSKSCSKRSSPASCSAGSMP
jgi:branched-chain amino acid transport system substrate-binding protein